MKRTSLFQKKWFDKAMLTSVCVALLGTALVAQAQLANINTTSVIETKNFSALMVSLPDVAKLRVSIIKPAGQTFHMYIKDAQGNLLNRVTGNRQSNQQTFKFNLTGLADGIYTVEMSDGKTITSRKIQKQTTPLAQPVLAERLICLN